jgi:hypothetical protein
VIRDKRSLSLHLKVQEMCDCYATTDPLKEMSDLPKDEDTQESALKWLALAILHGINDNAKKISLTQSKLPSPGHEAIAIASPHLCYFSYGWILIRNQSFAMPITPQATLAPAFPVGWLTKSSSPAWIIIARPTME